MSYDQLVIEFMSSLHVDWVGLYRGQNVLITFCMFNTNHWMSLRGFNELFHLLVNADALRDVPGLRILDPVWLSITCFKHKTYTDRFGRPRIYVPMKAKAMDICNISTRYLQCVMANIIFGSLDSQNVYKKA